MYLTESHVINNSNVNFKSCDNLSYLSKNLFNQALFLFKKEYENTGRFLRYRDIEKILKNEPFEINNYNKLTASVSQQTLMVFDRNVKSFLGLLKIFKKDRKKLKGAPKLMKFKNKKGRNLVVIRGDKYVAKVKEGFIYFPKKLNLMPIKTINVKNQEQLHQVRIIPKASCYNIEIIYNVEEKENNNLGKASIDLGINNLASLYTNNGNSYLINGKDIKSINKYYNKLKAKMQSELLLKQGNYKSKKINELTERRNRKIKDKLHKKSRKIIEILKENKIKELVIGYNKEWKQGIKLGKKVNQTFVSIPFQRFIDMIIYKCKLEGINVILHEESYTSKCSAIDLEPINKRKAYKGKRIKRGLFKSEKGILINSDINGSINIGRKVFGDDYFNPTNTGFVFNPIKIKTF